MSRPPLGGPGVGPTIALFSFTTNQSPIGDSFSTAWIRLSRTTRGRRDSRHWPNAAQGRCPGHRRKCVGCSKAKLNLKTSILNQDRSNSSCDDDINSCASRPSIGFLTKEKHQTEGEGRARSRFHLRASDNASTDLVNKLSLVTSG